MRAQYSIVILLNAATGVEKLHDSMRTTNKGSPLLLRGFSGVLDTVARRLYVFADTCRCVAG
jgi:hypothetical protein